MKIYEKQQQDLFNFSVDVWDEFTEEIKSKYQNLKTFILIFSINL
jgi:hypothetical protein